MAYPKKIVTCCYCGTRAALVLKGKDRHELACTNCGAPLHDLKMLRKDATGDRELVKPLKRGVTPKTPKRKRRGRLWAKVLDEAFDLIEDIFD